MTILAHIIDFLTRVIGDVLAVPFSLLLLAGVVFAVVASAVIVVTRPDSLPATTSIETCDECKRTFVAQLDADGYPVDIFDGSGRVTCPDCYCDECTGAHANGECPDLLDESDGYDDLIEISRDRAILDRA